MNLKKKHQNIQSKHIKNAKNCRMLHTKNTTLFSRSKNSTRPCWFYGTIGVEELAEPYESDWRESNRRIHTLIAYYGIDAETPKISMYVLLVHIFWSIHNTWTLHCCVRTNIKIYLLIACLVGRNKMMRNDVSFTLIARPNAVACKQIALL